MRKLIILPLIIIPLLSFANSDIPPEIRIDGQRLSTPNSGLISQSQQTPPPTSRYNGGPSAANLAAEKAAKCEAVPEIIKKAGEIYSKCVDGADTQFSIDRKVCSSSSLTTTTKGLTLTNGGTIGYSKISVEGMTPKECNDIATTDHAGKIKNTCDADYSHAKDYANAIKEANCPK